MTSVTDLSLVTIDLCYLSPHSGVALVRFCFHLFYISTQLRPLAMLTSSASLLHCLHSSSSLSLHPYCFPCKQQSGLMAQSSSAYALGKFSW